MQVITNLAKINEALNRGVDNIYPAREALERVLKSGKKLRIYNGIDPTNPNLHLGNAISLQKLRQFQMLGHKVILLIGDFTGRIGDPSDKSATRPRLSHQQVLENAENYQEQASKILDFKSKNNPCEIKFNSHWLDKLTNKEVVELASCFTVQQVIERDLFQKRLKEKKPIGLHEFLYPLYQGYDSVAMNVDMEIGGDDQTFNMLIGRALVDIYRHKEKFVLTTPLLLGADGRKMSKSWGNVINIPDAPGEMYGKVMSIKDELIYNYFELCTNIPHRELKEIKKKLKTRAVNPRDLKAKLAEEIVRIYHGERAARVAGKEFGRVFKEKKLPTKIPEVKIEEKTLNILDLLVKTKLAPSKSEAKRLILQKGVKIDGEIEEDWKKNVRINKGQVLQVGRRKFTKII